MHTIPVPVASKDPNQKINKRNRKDSAHVSQIIHEIMNQLSVIWFCNHQLRDLLSGDLDEAQRKQFEVIARAVNPNPTFFQPREASEPYSRGQWDSALKATPHSPKVMFHMSGHQSELPARMPTAFGLAVLACC